ncbi:MAG: response regulator [Alphaproteobacteria bacterium]|nr:response regulator [Alphaproteobacteria bacterium]
MKSCLIVDDSRVIRKVARQILEGMGFGCTEAEDGQQALNETRKSIPDIILLDWNMPIMNGMEFMKQFHGLPNAQGTKIIFCTTENDMTHIREALSAGASEYIMKPFDADIIRGKLTQLGVITQ